MRGSYDPRQLEQQIRQFWEQEKIPQKARIRGEKPFYFLDGPPYVTNPIHVGTAWNKLLKDTYIRYYRMRGYQVVDTPGFDTHGLPIEVRVERELGVKSKREIEERIGVEIFIKKCREQALKHMRMQIEQYRNLGVWMEWEHPYITLKDDYIEYVWNFVKRVYEKGALKRGYGVFHWCYRCGTVLSEHEASMEEAYKEVEEDSIYVKFPLKDRERTYLLVWTTTPWTIPDNVAVAAHPDIYYVEVSAGEERYILAETRLEILETAGIRYEVIRRVRGEELEGVRYRHPLEGLILRDLKDLRIVVSEEVVKPYEGTGLVHIAPAHGEEDFYLSQVYNLPIINLVGKDGRFVQGSGKYEGLNVFDANPIIVEDLQERGLLFKIERIRHRYPFCWRCKTPLIYMLTEQWYIDVAPYRAKLLELYERSEWVPRRIGEERFRKWLENARRWVISRQRYWGVPLPIWVCSECGYVLVIGSKAELLSHLKRGREPPELHRPYVDEVILNCPQCGGDCQRVPDVVDVWMDSGVAPWAALSFVSLPKAPKTPPADLIIEGHDQTRGWFYTTLVVGALGFDALPWRRVVVHGFVLDREGRAMHKSLGNVIDPIDVVKKYGCDALRLYELQFTVWEDSRFVLEEVLQAYRTLAQIWNVYRFASLYMELDRFSPPNNPDMHIREMEVEDRWLLAKIEVVKQRYVEYMERGMLHKALMEVINFLIEDVSRTYIRIVRRRVWEEDVEKQGLYTALYFALRDALLLLAPFVPFITEAIYQRVFRPFEKEESVHLCHIPPPRPTLLNHELLGDMKVVKKVVETAARIRADESIKLRQPLTALYIHGDEQWVQRLRVWAHVFRDLCNVLSVSYKPPPPNVVQREVDGVKVGLDVTISPELRALGWAREVVRRVQVMRKDLGLDIEEYIVLHVAGDDELIAAVRRNEEYVRTETRAIKVIYHTAPSERAREWRIDGKPLWLEIERTACE